jgi:hypothetical protein
MSAQCVSSISAKSLIYGAHAVCGCVPVTILDPLLNEVTLNWQKLLWEGVQEVVKKSGRDELMWVAIHKCVEAMLGISLYSYFTSN